MYITSHQTHHIFTVPIGFLQKAVKELFQYFFTWNNPDSKATSMIKRTFTLSMVMYLSVISAVVFLLFEEWHSYLLTHHVSVISYKQGLYNYCNGTTITGDTVNNTINVRNYMTDDTYLKSDNKRLFFLAISIVLFFYHLLDSLTNCTKVSTNFLDFFAGYEAKECEQSMEQIPEQIPLENIQDELEERIKQRHQDILFDRTSSNDSHTNICSKVTLCVFSFIGLSIVVFVICLPQLFFLFEIEPVNSGKYILWKIVFHEHLQVFITLFISLQNPHGTAKVTQGMTVTFRSW